MSLNKRRNISDVVKGCRVGKKPTLVKLGADNIQSVDTPLVADRLANQAVEPEVVQEEKPVVVPEEKPKQEDKPAPRYNAAIMRKVKTMYADLTTVYKRYLLESNMAPLVYLSETNDPINKTINFGKLGCMVDMNVSNAIISALQHSILSFVSLRALTNITSDIKKGYIVGFISHSDLYNIVNGHLHILAYSPEEQTLIADIMFRDGGAESADAKTYSTEFSKPEDMYDLLESLMAKTVADAVKHRGVYSSILPFSRNKDNIEKYALKFDAYMTKQLPCDKVYSLYCNGAQFDVTDSVENSRKLADQLVYPVTAALAKIVSDVGFSPNVVSIVKNLTCTANLDMDGSSKLKSSNCAFEYCNVKGVSIFTFNLHLGAYVNYLNPATRDASSISKDRVFIGKDVISALGGIARHTLRY